MKARRSRSRTILFMTINLKEFQLEKSGLFLNSIYCFLELSINISQLLGTTPSTLGRKSMGLPDPDNFFICADPNLDPDPSIYS
jgi:hypothetical protein